MNFEKLPPVETAEQLLDLAFRRAREKQEQQKKKHRMKKSEQAFLNEIRQKEMKRINVIHDVLGDRLFNILKSFPNFIQLPLFYYELVQITIEYPLLKKALGSVNWCIKKNSQLFHEYTGRLKGAKKAQEMQRIRTEFYGRASSIVKQMKEPLLFLEQARKVMKDYPDIKELPTVAIIGFPNVGKTTLLMKLTGSKAEIASYAFTTKGINTGYATIDGKKIQFLDTPGSLNRFEKMNNIEKQAHLALKQLAQAVIYVFDLTEPYPLQKQLELYWRIRKELKKEMFVYVSKSDVIDGEEIKRFEKENKIKTEGIDEINEQIRRRFHEA